MKSLKRITGLLLCMVLATSFLLGGCANEKEQIESKYAIYYLNQEGTSIVRQPYEFSMTDAPGQVAEATDKLTEDTGSVDYWKVISGDVALLNYDYSARQIRLNFNESYNELSPSEEVMIRGSIVLTLTQIDGVDRVSFLVEGKPLTDQKNHVVGAMTKDSFLDHPGEPLENVQETDVTLYFASADGQTLEKEVQHVHYSSNIALEKLVMERLLEGPHSEDAIRSIPENTGLISVSVMDGVCFVNLDENFLNQDYTVTEDVVIYSIVNSLTELSNIDTVQISVNSETNTVYREKYSLQEHYETNKELTNQQGSPELIHIDE